MLTTQLSRRDWLKVSAVGAAGALVPLGLTSTVSAHDQMKPNGLDFTLEDVRLGQSLFTHPRTGQVTTQNERRAMVEMRLHVGMYKAIAAVQKMAAAGSDSRGGFGKAIS